LQCTDASGRDVSCRRGNIHHNKIDRSVDDASVDRQVPCCDRISNRTVRLGQNAHATL